MKNLKDKLEKQRSKKAHKQDPAKNDTFNEQNTPDKKAHKGKVPHGKFYGKRWFPQ